MKVLNVDKNVLLQILKKIYETFNNYLKSANKKVSNNQTQKNDNFKRIYTKVSKDTNNFDKISKNSNFNLNDLNDTKSMNDMNSYTMKKIA